MNDILERLIDRQLAAEEEARENFLTRAAELAGASKDHVRRMIDQKDPRVYYKKNKVINAFTTFQKELKVDGIAEASKYIIIIELKQISF